MADAPDPGDLFADELADALRSPAHPAPGPKPPGPAPARTRVRSGPRPHDPVPDVLRNRSFSKLFSEEPAGPAGDAWAPDASPDADTDGPTGEAVVVIRDDPSTGLIELHAGAPGPAGEASIDLEGGLTISVDAAAPRRLTSIVIDRTGADEDGNGEVPSLGTIVHPMIEQLLTRGVATDGEWHAVELHDARASDLDALGRFILLTDEAGSTPIAGHGSEGPAGGRLPQAALFTEALTHIPRSLRIGLGGLPVTWARRAADLLLAADGGDDLEIPDAIAAQELANGARAAAQVLAAADGPNRLEDRRTGRRMGSLADRLVERSGDGGDAPPSGAADDPERAVRALPDRAAIEVQAAPALRDRQARVARQIASDASVRVLGPGEIEVSVALDSGGEEPAAPSALWARVTRRAGAVPLALAPLRPDDPDAPAAVLRGRAVLPVDLSVGDITIDITDDPAEPVPTDAATALDEAITAGRAACRHERRGEIEDASRAWERCADAWSALGDEHRAAVARRYASGSHPGQVIPFLADRLT